ncbi:MULTISPECIES: heavy metal translocating P-type ATPase [Methylobacterium]|uniref:Copper-transporting P-type ATPase n=1 Tax=Methylobacterium thuringiense TaxID=1003091 RepID=A0ABQ4TLZ4_9HYPH|nr:MULTISPECIES: heavy metal translocating P-type ATPase [Methylobacterium]TXN20653.1 cadmium-translocating P-type ATPase [Methylobacterium sp. WL9]GJE56395.1 Copper-transporting P-type ATPase [Methylobacterium thuringiense]
MDARTDFPLPRSAPTADRPRATITLPIEGLSCASCVSRVERALLDLPDVRDVSVNLATGKASLSLPAGMPAHRVAEAIAAAGYTVPETTSAVGIGGMTCASCVARVERTLLRIPGVTGAVVNLASGRAELRHADGTVAMAEIEETVRQAGFELQSVGSDAGRTPDREDRQARETAQLWRDVRLSALLAAPVVLLDMGGHFIPGFHESVDGLFGNGANALLQAALATLVLAWPGRRFFRSGIPGLLRGHPDMNALVALGAGAAYLASMIATLAPGLLPQGGAQLYFEASVLIVTLILLGRALEARARGRTGAAIARLLDLAPKTARVMRDGEETEILVTDLKLGDRVRVRPGERVPADGRLVAGASWIDESMVTGEPDPVRKGEGDATIGGTLNTSGGFDLRVETVGSGTVLAQIARMVEAAQGGKLPVQGLVDRITARFVPAVLAISAATFLAWLALAPSPALGPALVHAIAVLIIACPCAMGLAVPVAIMVGTGRAAERGVLFRKGSALQVLENVKVVAFDKTGTLTEGRPRLTDLVTAEGFSREEVLAAAGAVEARSEHPIARAIVTAAREAGSIAEVEAFEAIPGHGVTGRVAGREIAIGAKRLMERLGIPAGSLDDAAERLGASGHSPLYAAIDGRLAALIAVADSVRPDAEGVIRSLQARGLVVAMITGDDRRTAQAVAATLGIDAVAAEVLPAGKVEAIERFRESHGSVAFVGDGINDAPALSGADVGIAIGTGTDVAIASADVVLMSCALGGVEEAFVLSRATMRTIRQNMFWAFAYNVGLIPVAAGALAAAGIPMLPPIVAASAMMLSSVCVVTNALRLRHARSAGRPA